MNRVLKTQWPLAISIDGVTIVAIPVVEKPGADISKIVGFRRLAVYSEELHGSDEIVACTVAANRFWQGQNLKRWIAVHQRGCAVHFDSGIGGRSQIRGSCRAAKPDDYPARDIGETITDEDYKPLPQARQRYDEIRCSLQAASRAFAKANNRLVEDASKIKGTFRTESAEKAKASLAAFRQEHPDIADLWKVVAEDRLEYVNDEVLCVHDEVLCVQQFMRETGMSEQPEIAVESPYMPGPEEYETPEPMKPRRFLLLMILLSLAAHVGLLFWIAYVEDLALWRIL